MQIADAGVVRWRIGNGIVNCAISEYAAIAWYLAKGRIGFADL